MTQELRIRIAHAEDADALIAFHAAVGGVQRTPEQWHWEFGNAVVALAEDAEGILGTQALLPMLGLYEGRQVLTAKSEYTLVGPRGRGRGVFAGLYEQCFRQARERGIEAVWGFTSAVKAFERVGFSIGPTMSLLALPLRVSRAARAVSSRIAAGWARPLVGAGLTVMFGVARGAARIAAPRTPAEIGGTSLFADISAAGTPSFTLARVPQLLDWRIRANPFRDHFVVSADGAQAIVAVLPERAWLSDLGASSYEQVVRMVATAAGESGKRGTALLTAWHFDAHELHGWTRRAFRRLGGFCRQSDTALVWWSDSLKLPHPARLYFPEVHSEGVG